LWDILRNVQGDNILKVSPGDSIQVAIDELESIGRGKIVLLAGTHVIDAALTVNDTGVYLTIEGMGDASVLKPSGDFNAITATNFKSLTLKNFSIDGTAWDSLSLTYGIFVNETADNRCFIENVNMSGDGTNGTGVYTTSNKVEVISCIFTSIAVGINFDSNFCVARDNQGYSLSQGLIALKGIGCISSNNISYNCLNGLSLEGCSQCIVEGNIVYNPTNYGIIFDGANYNTINSNSVYSAGTTGIFIQDSSVYNNLVGNSISDGAGWGIVIEADSNNNTIGATSYYNNTSGTISDSGTGTKQVAYV